MAILRPLDTLKTPRECGLKLLEEASEACEAMKELERVSDMRCGDVGAAYATGRMGWLKKQALFELADVLQVIANCLHVLDATPEEQERAVKAVQESNEGRGRHGVDGSRTLTVVAWRDDVGASLADLYGILGEERSDD